MEWRTPLPPEPIQVDSPPHIENDSLRFEQMPLQLVGIAARSRAHLTTGVDDAVPRDAGSGRKAVECVADLARMPFQAGKLRNLAVGGHAPARHAANDGIDPLPARGG